MRFRRLGATAAAAMIAAPALASCGGDENKAEEITVAGQTVSDPKKVLDDAWSSFTDSNQAAIDSKSVTVAEGASCFFRRDSKGSTSVVEKVFCGPIKRAGSTDEQAWDVYGLNVSSSSTAATSSGGSTVSVGSLDQQNGTVDASLLVRPDSTKPANPKDLAAPKAPRTDQKNFAMLAPEAESGFDLKKLDKPATLVTPSATIKVEASGTRDTLPAWAVDQGSTGGDSSAGDSSDGDQETTEFRPADGQKVSAYRVTIGPGPEYPDSNADGGFGDDEAKDASTALSVGVGGQQLSIADQSNDQDSYGSPEESTYTVTCSSLPCQGDRSSNSYLLVASHDKSGKPNLTATVDGKQVVLPLDGSTSESPVSDVLTTRKNREQQLNASFPETKTSVDFDPEYDSDDQEFTFSGGVPTVFLTSFDRTAGWAAKDKAWLEVPMNEVDLDQHPFEVETKSSFWLQVGKEKVMPKSGAGSEDTLVFEVPADFTKGELNAQPQGSATGFKDVDKVTKRFKQSKALTVDIAITAG